MTRDEKSYEAGRSFGRRWAGPFLTVVVGLYGLTGLVGFARLVFGA